MRIKISTLAIAIYAFLIAILLFYPTIQLAIVAFTDEINFPPSRFNLKAFNEILWPFWASLRFSVELGIAVTFSNILMCLPLAYVLERHNFKGKSTVEIFMFMPFMFPGISYMTAMFVFYVLYTPQLMDTFIGLAIPTVLFNTIYLLRSIRASLALVDPVYEEAAMCMGASRLKAFFKIDLPLLAPGLISGSMIVFANSSTAFIAPQVLGRKIISTGTKQVYEDMSRYGLLPFIAGEALIIEALVMGIILAVYFVLRRHFRGFMV
jgi:putative spermidine/putrescine transport system permease protein